MLLMRPEGGSIIGTRDRMYTLLVESRIEGKDEDDGAATRGEKTCSKS